MVVPNEAVSSGEIPMNKAQLFQVAATQKLLSVFSSQCHHSCDSHHSFIIVMVIIMILARPHAIGDLGCHVHQHNLVDLVPGMDWDYNRYNMVMIMTMRMIVRMLRILSLKDDCEDEDCK